MGAELVAELNLVSPYSSSPFLRRLEKFMPVRVTQLQVSVFDQDFKAFNLDRSSDFKSSDSFALALNWE